MTLTESVTAAGDAETTLVGQLHDQTALSGVLTTVYSLHLTLLSVERIEEARPE
jgi:hypothetical protein